MHLLLFNSVSLTISQFVRIVINSALVILVARYLGPAGLGQFAIVTAFYILFQNLATLGVPAYLVRMIARDSATYPKQFQNALANQLFSAIIAASILIGVSQIAGYSFEVVGGLQIVAFGLIPFALSSTVESVLQGLEKIGSVAMLQIVARIVQFLGSILFLQLGFGVTGLAWMLLLGQSVSAVIGMWIATTNLQVWKDFAVDWIESFRLVVHSIDFFLLTLANSLFAKMDTLILSLFADEIVTGYYNAAFLVIQVVTLSITGAAGAAFPLLSRLHHSKSAEFQRLLDILLRGGVLYALAASLVLLFGAVPIVNLVFRDPSYAFSSFLLQLLAPFVVFFTINLFVANGLIAASLQRNSLVISITKLLVSLILYFALTQVWLSVGTAVATVLSALVATILNLIIFNRTVYRMDLWRIIYKPVLLALLTFVIFNRTGSLLSVAVSIMSVLFFLALSFVFKVITRNDLNLLRLCFLRQ